MGRRYAGVLGSLVFATVLFRGLLLGDDVASTLNLATSCLFGFAVLGLVAGRIAEATILESVKTQIETDWKTGREADAAKAI